MAPMVVRTLGEPPTRADPSEIFGLFDSGGADIAHEKDSYVDAAVDARHRSHDAR